MAEEQSKPSPLSLRDVINYDPDRYLQDDEVAWIQTTFRNNPKAIRTLQKIFLPAVADTMQPIEQFANDAFGAGYDFAQVPHEELKAIILARQDAIKFVAGGLIKLKLVANNKPETDQERANRKQKDSAR
jgi:hypothetical protein